MICRLCLKDEAQVFNIFTDKGATLQVVDVIARHFWFEPKSDDPISTVICIECWNKIYEFNEFYKFVADRHRLLTERFSLTLEGNRPHRKSSDIFQNNNSTTTATTTPTTTTTTTTSTVPTIDSCKTKTEAEKTAIAVDHYVETYFPVELDDRNAEALSKIETEIEIQPLEADDLHFGDENELTEYLSLEEGNPQEDTLAVTPAVEENSENKRLTRAESKRSRGQEKESSPAPKKCKRKSQTVKSKELKTTKSSGRARKNLRKVSESKGPTENPSYPCSDDRKSEEKSANRRTKFHSIDERISKHLSLQCDVCGAKGATFGDLAKHMHEQHNFRRGYAICCEKKFYRRSLLYHHIETHLDPDCFKCQQCEKSFASKQCLRNHMYVKHQPDEAKTFSCNFCEKKFAKSYLLEQHQRKHDERTHICEVCKKGFATISLLNAHIKVIHNNYGTMCDVCAKVIRGRSAFARHVLEHEGVTPPKVQCPKCNAWYKNKHSLQKHIRRHNDEGTLHMCPDCGKVAPNRSALLAHMRYVHKERVYECGICKKSFKKQIGLKEHMTMHTGETLYNCPYCSRTFNSNANMHSHRKKVHPKEFAETRRKRHESKIMCSENGITSNPQEAREQEQEQEPEREKEEEKEEQEQLTTQTETSELTLAAMTMELIF